MRRAIVIASIAGLVGFGIPLVAPPGAAAGPVLLPRAITTGSWHSCAVNSSGGIGCWGGNTSGQATPPDGHFTTVAGGNAHTCAVREDGTLACWGANTNHQTEAPAGSYKTVAAGNTHNCAIKTDDTVACWGNNFSGQSTPPAGGYKALSGGMYHTCGIETDGTLICWGSNADGAAPLPTGTYLDVSVGSRHTCAVATDGDLACWGWNENGQSTPPAGTYAHVAGGERHSCAIASDGTIDCWGDNEYGQSAPPAGTYVAIDAGAYHTCAIATTGTMRCWGRDDIGQASVPLLLTLSGLTSPRTAGVSGTVTVRAIDPFGAREDAYTGTVHFTSTDTRAVLPADHAFVAADAGEHSFSVTFKTAGSQALRARDTSDSSITARLNGIAVNAAPLAGFAVSGISDPGTAGGPASARVRAVDAFGNTAIGYLGTVHFTSTDPQAVLPADHAFVVSDSGVHYFTVTLKTAGEQAVRARDTVTPTITGIQQHITVRPMGAMRLIVSGIADPYLAGGPDGFTVQALDAYGNTASGYRGTVHFTSTDAAATLPSDYTFTAADAGMHMFTLRLETGGEQAVRARDTVSATITGVQEHISVHH